MGKAGNEKGGDRAPFFVLRVRRASYRFLPPFFFPPLAAFFAIALIPPLHSWVCEDSHRIARPLPPGTPGLRLSASFASWSTPASQEVSVTKKGVSPLDTPGPAGRPCLALLSALFLAALRSLLRHYSSLERGSSALLPVPEGYNRWAERSTLIQHVDYG